jgi:hypothetical protein
MPEWRVLPVAIIDNSLEARSPTLPGGRTARWKTLFVLSIVACAAVSAALSGCTSSPSHAQMKGERHAKVTSGGDVGRPGVAVPNWQNPIDGIAVSSVQAAQLVVNFPVVAVPGFGDPSAILVTPDTTPADTVVVLQYQTASSGLIDVYEEATTLSATDFQGVIDSWVAVNGQPGTEGSVTAVTLSDGVPALITTTSDGARSDIRWIQGGVEYTIRGPSLAQKDCTIFANALAGAASSPSQSPSPSPSVAVS